MPASTTARARPVDRLTDATWVVWTSAGLHWRSNVGVLSMVVTVVLPATFLVVTARAVPAPGPDLGTRLVVAIGLMSLWSSTVWGAGGALRRELRDGTFSGVVAGAYPPHLVLIGRSLGGTTHAMAMIAPTIAVTVALLGLPVHIRQPLWVGVGLLVIVASGTALGMLLACIFLLTRYGPQLSSVLMYPMYLIGGLLIPPESLPDALRPVAACVSLRWATEFLVLAASGRVRLTPLLLAVGLTVLYFVIGHFAFSRIVTLARKDGRFEL
jgi:ABC-2 type transport system permease protein